MLAIDRGDTKRSGFVRATAREYIVREFLYVLHGVWVSLYTIVQLALRGLCTPVRILFYKLVQGKVAWYFRSLKPSSYSALASLFCSLPPASAIYRTCCVISWDLRGADYKHELARYAFAQDTELKEAPNWVSYFAKISPASHIVKVRDAKHEYSMCFQVCVLIWYDMIYI